METIIPLIPGLILSGVVIGVVGLASCPPPKLEQGLESLVGNIKKTFESISHAFVKQGPKLKK